MTDLIVLLDASGSMKSMGAEPVQAMNTFIKEQQKADIKESLFSLYTFASDIRKIYDRVDLSTVVEYKNYHPDGMTRLFDCIKQAITDNQERKNVVFVIITDGDDTASQKCRAGEAKQLIATREKDYNWQLVFLGANESSFKAGNDLGIAPVATAKYSQTRFGDLNKMMRQLSAPIASYRSVSSSSPLPQKLNLYSSPLAIHSR